MTFRMRFGAALLGLGAAAAIASAPSAFAASVTTTHDVGGATMTERPGHVSIHAEPRVVSSHDWGPFI